MQFVNDRMKEIPVSGGLYEIFQQALALEKSGKTIIHMEIGRPDFDTPEVAKQAAIKALGDGFVHYTEMAGIDELRYAIAEKEKRCSGIDINPDTEIIVTAGACEALFSIMIALLNPGDEIIIPSPYFSAYKDMAIISGIKIVEVPLKIENDFRLKVADVEEKITPKTKAVLVNTPHNPTGAILEYEDLKAIAELVKKHDLLMISDETYDQFLFEGRHISISTFEGMKERTIIINSASKSYSMTGWRIGYAIGPREIITSLNRAHQNMSTCATSFAQVGAAHAYRSGTECIKPMVNEFKRRRDLIVHYLSQIKEIEYVVPKGAFYIFPKLRNLNISSADFCKYILEEAGIAIVPGECFGEYGTGFFRMAYACSYENVELAMKRFKAAVEKLASNADLK